MLFSSVSFLYFFLPLVLLCYFPVKNRAWRNGVLLVFSLLFYSWGEPKYLLLMLASVLASWLCGLGIDAFRENKRKSRFFLLLSVALLLGCLFVFKYLGFFVRNLEALTGASLGIREIVLPIGISFYTFQILSYVIDLYRGDCRVQRNVFHFALYVSFFPQLIAGPIVRYQTVQDEMADRRESWDDAVYGLRRFITGLAKKVLLANNVAAIAEYIYAPASGAGTAAYWLAALCYSLQIYFDFSGYSDMAIGLGRIFGFHFLENFNYPYAARSITDFWRRWHISLSSWFRDYVYIPLGGSRAGKYRQTVNLVIVWALTGMWHGDRWNFILWGLYYAALLIIEKLFLSKLLGKLPSLLQRLYTLFFVVIGWVIFRLTELSGLSSALRCMFAFSRTDWGALIAGDAGIAMRLLFLPAALLFSFPVLKKVKSAEETALKSLLINLCCLALLALSVAFIVSSAYNPFIYFRF